MPYLLDTTLLIDHAAARPGAVALVQRLFGDGDLHLRCGCCRGMLEGE
jgi:hypothetical protein